MSNTPPPPAPLTTWEQAYVTFETPEQTEAKFLRRLRVMGVASWSRDLRIVELMCGSGASLRAWERLGFSHLEGLDYSQALLACYRGPARCVRGDVRELPFPDQSRDVLAVHGGLHHLSLMHDLERTLDEMRRVLRPDGRLLVVEPWLTPFLRFVHTVVDMPVARRCSRKINALGVMIDHERETYLSWLHQPRHILDALHARFEPQFMRRGWGKLMLVARPRKAPG